MKIVLISAISIFSVIGISFLRKVSLPASLTISQNTVINFLGQPTLWLGIFFSGLTFLLYIWVLAKYQVSSSMPLILAMNLLLVLVVSIFIFGETVTTKQLIGYCLLLGSIWFLMS